MRSLELVACHGEAQERNEAVRRDGRNTSSGHQRREGDGTREDRAQDDGTEDIHDGHCIARLAICIHAANPVGHWQNAIARNGKDQARSSDDGDTSVLQYSEQ